MFPQEALEQLLQMTMRLITTDGVRQTIIPFLSLVRHTAQTPAIPSVLTPSFCLVLQGAKEVRLGRDALRYRAGDYLASVIDLPAFAQVVGASRQAPYYGLRIDLTTKDIASVVAEAHIAIESGEEKPGLGAYVGKSDADFVDLFIRLLKLLERPKEAPFLSALLKREMIFRLLSGTASRFFLQQVLFEQQAEGVGKAITWIKEHYEQSFTVEELAIANNMSVSGLHHKFKAITTMGPLQYQKRLRLQEARRLLLSGRVDVTAAALEVGYESPSQFSREYRRLFGLPPLQDIKAVRKHVLADAFLASLGVGVDQRAESSNAH
ncbi:AraC family transcriptional regulator [Ktedonospora formicarum]|uniref:AraC family transcriptional regulator n=1 Tax=Ktedonospora formicarum TaxID=2778364 RepID=UPI001C68AAB7|nr:AraC family transcriptional regulator [Ktedonospora formicarum]